MTKYGGVLWCAASFVVIVVIVHSIFFAKQVLVTIHDTFATIQFFIEHLQADQDRQKAS